MEIKKNQVWFNHSNQQYVIIDNVNEDGITYQIDEYSLKFTRYNELFTEFCTYVGRIDDVKEKCNCKYCFYYFENTETQCNCGRCRKWRKELEKARRTNESK